MFFNLFLYDFICVLYDLSATVPSGTIVECSRVYVGSWDPWDPGTVVLEIPKGFLRGQQESGGPAP